MKLEKFHELITSEYSKDRTIKESCCFICNKDNNLLYICRHDGGSKVYYDWVCIKCAIWLIDMQHAISFKKTHNDNN